MIKLTKKQKEIRDNYKKKTGKEMPPPRKLKDRWEKEEMIIIKKQK
ncbi:MAG TPA: hypothetical protein IAB59_00285 [Candidatus Onthousia faecipullorum]|uniref:Uncharacterized protein n=1 Tax=Candidatus Onthousia faecipullorum TaxID=2840887 RepID=A0A9D1G9V1_9FIRM|nr:hypothetical protein [Candidatus Onthousia faecipullorum]